MNHAEQPDVIRTRMLEVVRTLQRLPDGPDRDALDTYRDQLAALGRTIEQPPPPAITQPAPVPRALAAPARAEHRTLTLATPSSLLADDRCSPRARTTSVVDRLSIGYEDPV